jgi:hypothetical protein
MSTCASPSAVANPSMAPTNMAECDHVKLGQILDDARNPSVALDQEHVARLDRPFQRSVIGRSRRLVAGNVFRQIRGGSFAEPAQNHISHSAPRMLPHLICLRSPPLTSAGVEPHTQPSIRLSAAGFRGLACPPGPGVGDPSQALAESMITRETAPATTRHTKRHSYEKLSNGRLRSAAGAL